MNEDVKIHHDCHQYPRPLQDRSIFLLLAMVVTVGSALGFQYIGGYLPCKLCLEQRYPYYAGIPLMALAVASSSLKWPAGLTRLLLALGGILMLIGLGLASSTRASNGSSGPARRIAPRFPCRSRPMQAICSMT